VRAAVLTASPPTLEVVERPDPVPARGEVVVRVTGCGICGSDLHVASMMGRPGTILGHEIAGTVAALGDGVDGWPLGRAVAVRPFTGCGACRWCQAGRADHCPSFEFIGFERPGGFAELVACDSRELFELPASVAGPDQALVEPLAVARRAMRRTGDVRGGTVTVLGAGPIGLGVVAWARRLGAAHVVVSDPSAERRALAAALGADHTVDPLRDDVGASVRERTGDAADAVIECSGHPGLINEALQLAAVDGRVTVVGMCMKPDTLLPWFGLSKELDVRFVIYHGREDFTDTLDELSAGTLPVAGLVSEVISLEALPARFAQLGHHPDTGKVVVGP
jgi:(R,R)-butanediol dehydrogenase / meso-butanediol dehydrogenase / diacetyl reductase